MNTEAFDPSVKKQDLKEIAEKLSPYISKLWHLKDLPEDRKEWTRSERMLLQWAYDIYTETISFSECCPCEIQACNYIKRIAQDNPTMMIDRYSNRYGKNGLVEVTEKNEVNLDQWFGETESWSPQLETWIGNK